MPQPKYESCSIKLSKSIGDEVYSAASDGKTFTAEDRRKAINRARGLVYTRMLHSLGIEEMTKMYPECLNVDTKELNPVKDADIRKAIKVLDIDNHLYPIEPIPVEQYFNAHFDTYAKYKGVKFAEYGSKIETININPV